ncbi:MAG TPA: hypothetical protein VII56_10590 [Rhizomicrobium sp.]
MNTRIKVAVLLLIAAVLPSSVRAANVDWKLYGGMQANAGNSYCFYEERGIQNLPNKFIRVWAKCLLQKDMDAVDATKPYFRAAVDMSGSRVAHYYMPPYVRIERTNAAQAIQVTTYEAIADVSDITPEAQLYYELDCKQRKIRTLQATIGTISSHAPLDWTNVAPEGNGANMVELLCPA